MARGLRVLISAPYFQPVVSDYAAIWAQHAIEPVVVPVVERLDEDALLEVIRDIDGAICGDDRFSARVLQQADQLKVIAKWGTGIDSIDLEACEARGIRVFNTPDAFSEAVSDSVLGYVLCFARRLPWMHQAIASGQWQKLPGRALAECTLGVIGTGHVGKAVVRKASALGMRVLGHDRLPMPSDWVARSGITMVDKWQLLAASDFITLHCDLNPTSQHLISAAELASVRRDAILINTARGGVVDEVALVASLAAGNLAGAALDVFEHEPLPADSPLRTMPNVLLAPHNANSSPRAWQRVHERTVDNLLSGLVYR